MNAGRVAQLRELRRYDDAEREARQALAADPQDAALLVELAAVLLAAHRDVDGLAAADAALATAPHAERAHRVRAVILSRLGRHDEALRSGFASVGLAPEEPFAALGYAVVLQQAGRLRDALAVARRAVELAPEEPAMHVRLADIASVLGDRTLARQAYAETLRLDPQHAVARHDLAVLDLAGRRPAEALRGLVEAGRMDPSIPEVLGNVAAVLWRLSWRVRALLIVGTLAVIAAGPSGGTRIAGTLVLVAVTALAWWTVRGLPPQTLPVVRAALRKDRPLAFTYLALALCVAVYVAVTITGFAPLAAVAWLVLLLLAGLALLVGLIRRLRTRR